MGKRGSRRDAGDGGMGMGMWVAGLVGPGSWVGGGRREEVGVWCWGGMRVAGGRAGGRYAMGSLSGGLGAASPWCGTWGGGVVVGGGGGSCGWGGGI